MPAEQVTEPVKKNRFGKRPLWVKIVLIVLSLVVLELLFTGRSLYQVMFLGLRKYGAIMTVLLLLITGIVYVFRKSKLRGRILILIIAALLIVGSIFSGLAPWEMYSYIRKYVRYKTLDKTITSQLPETAYEPIQPRISIQTLAEQRVRETEAVTEPYLVRDSNEYRWTMALQPSPKYNYQRFFESTQAIFSVSVEAPSPNFSEEHRFPVHFTIGERLLFSRKTHTAIIRSFNLIQLFTLEPGETRYMRDDSGQWVEVTPLICWKGIFFPRPEFGGVHVIKQGATEFVKRILLGAGKVYSPSEMQQFKYLQNQNLMPEKVSRYSTESFRFQEGFLAPLPMYHKGDVRIPEIKDGISKQPMTAFFRMSEVVPNAKDMLYQYYALEPYDTSKHGLNTSIFIPADGEMKVYVFNHANDGTAGTSSVPSKIRESKMSYDWSVNKVADVRPYFRNIGGKVRPLWLTSVVTAMQSGDRYLSGGVPAIAVVDAKYDRVVWLSADKPELWNAQIEAELGGVWKQ